jgi:hypothetical protein
MEDKAFYASVIISMARVYDVLLVMLAESSPEQAKRLRAAHAAGVLYAPPPSFTKDEDDSDSD